MLVSIPQWGTDKVMPTPWQWQTQQLCEMIELMWWRFPLDYKRSLHATFSAPLGTGGAPSCYLVQLSIKQHACKLRSSVAYHVRQAPRMTLPAADAYSILYYMWNTLQIDEDVRQVMLGLLVDTERPWWWHWNPTHLPQIPAYHSIFCDYLISLYYCSGGTATMDMADRNMIRN